MNKNYFEHKGRVIEKDTRFEHVMAIALNPKSNYKDGIVRCITKRDGDVGFRGFTDRSELYKVTGTSLLSFNIGERLNIKNEKEILKELIGNQEEWDFLGLEDPDIWIDEKTDLMHIYITIPLINKNKKLGNKIHLGHAFGKDLNSLEMTIPVLLAMESRRAKEVSIAPINKQGVRFNLIEAKRKEGDVSYSVVEKVIVKYMGRDWEFSEVLFHPKEHNIPWIAGHASPGPLFSKNFIDVGEGKLLGVINGREADEKIGDQIKRGMFSVGLFIYDYENGKIDWVSPEPFIEDSEAKTITFASCFIETEKGKGILYAHVDDSFVRAYDLDAEKIKPLLPNLK